MRPMTRPQVAAGPTTSGLQRKYDRMRAASRLLRRRLVRVNTLALTASWPGTQSTTLGPTVVTLETTRLGPGVHQRLALPSPPPPHLRRRGRTGARRPHPAERGRAGEGPPRLPVRGL